MQPNGRLYSKTIVWQGDPLYSPGGVTPPGVELIVTPPPAPPPRPRVITWIGDPNSAPVVTATTTAPTVLVTGQPPRPATRTITWIGDPNAAPLAGTTTAQPVIVSAEPAPLPRGLAILGAAAADIYFSGPLVATATAQQQKPPFVVTRIGDPNAAPPATGGPVPFCLVVTDQPPAPRTAVILEQQLQDGYLPVPKALVWAQQPPRLPRTRTYLWIGDPSAAGPPPVLPDTNPYILLIREHGNLRLAEHAPVLINERAPLRIREGR